MNDPKEMDIMDALADGSDGSFRERSARVGVVYTMTYDRATVTVYDFDREKAGGLPKGAFLVAAKQTGRQGLRPSAYPQGSPPAERGGKRSRETAGRGEHGQRPALERSSR